MNINKIVRTFGITAGIAVGTATAAAAASGGGFPGFESGRREVAPATTTTVRVRTEPAPTTTTTTTRTTPRRPEPTPTTIVKPAEPTTVPVVVVPVVEPIVQPAIQPIAEPTTTIAKRSEPTTIPKPPEPTREPTPEPTPTPTTVHAEPKPETPTPASIELNCTKSTEGTPTVTCNWSGALPQGATKFMLLRSKQGEGRVLVAGADVHSFTDTTMTPGVAYNYLVVATAGSGPTLGHSNPVAIQA